MPEVILPKMERCPCCNTTHVLLMKDHTYQGQSFYVQCGELCHRKHVTAQATPEEAIAKWNVLPRALRWTHEPPKVAGWYWWDNGSVQSLARVRVIDGKLSMTDYGCREIKIHDCDLVERWAGPIPAPID